MPVCTITPQHSTTSNKTHNTQPLLCHLTMADAPTVKHWGKNDKELLQKLIDKCKINITRAGDADYIDRIHHKYFRLRDNLNFRRNFQNYAGSCDLEELLSGYR
jgi:hypothetical protein